MRRVRTVLVLVLLALGTAWEGRAAAGAPPRRADARRLVAIAARGLDGVASAHAAAPGGPVLAGALDAMRRSLAAVGAAVAARSPELFPALSAGSLALAELRVAAGRAELDARAGAGLRTLTDAWTLLRGTYGQEGVRHRQGGPLTEPEERRLRAMQRAHARLAQELRPLQGQAEASGDLAAAADLARLAGRAGALAAAPPTLGSFLLASVLGDEMRGEWAAGSRLAPPAARAARRRLDPVVESLSADAGAGFVFAIDLDAAQSWAFLDEETELPEDLAAADPAPRPDLREAVPAPDLAASAPEEETYLPGPEDGEFGVANEAAPFEPVVWEGTDETEGVEGGEPAAAPEITADDLAAAAEAFAAEEGGEPGPDAVHPEDAGHAEEVPGEETGGEVACAAGTDECITLPPPDGR